MDTIKQNFKAFSTFFIVCASVLLLTSCENTGKGMREDFKENSEKAEESLEEAGEEMEAAAEEAGDEIEEATDKLKD